MGLRLHERWLNALLASLWGLYGRQCTRDDHVKQEARLLTSLSQNFNVLHALGEAGTLCHRVAYSSGLGVAEKAAGMKMAGRALMPWYPVLCPRPAWQASRGTVKTRIQLVLCRPPHPRSPLPHFRSQVKYLLQPLLAWSWQKNPEMVIQFSQVGTIGSH